MVEWEANLGHRVKDSLPRGVIALGGIILALSAALACQIEEEASPTPSSTSSNELIKIPGTEIEILESRLSDYESPQDLDVLERLQWLHDAVAQKTGGSANIVNPNYHLIITTAIANPGIESPDPSNRITGIYLNVTSADDLIASRQALETEIKEFFGTEPSQVCQVLKIGMDYRLRDDINPNEFSAPQPEVYQVNSGCLGQ